MEEPRLESRSPVDGFNMFANEDSPAVEDPTDTSSIDVAIKNYDFGAHASTLKENYFSNGNFNKADPETVFWKNSPFFYDGILLHHLDWPAITVEFMSSWSSGKLKSRTKSNLGWSTHRLLMGTCTSGQDTNYLIMGDLKFPDFTFLLDDPMKCESFSGFISPKVRARNNLPAVPSVPMFDTKARIVHPGDVNRAVSKPDNSFMIVTHTVTGDLLLFDYSKHPSYPSDLTVSRPQLILKGHKTEGFGISWSQLGEDGIFASCSNDGSIAIWNINRTRSLGMGSSNDSPSPLRGSEASHFLSTSAPSSEAADVKIAENVAVASPISMWQATTKHSFVSSPLVDKFSGTSHAYIQPPLVFNGGISLHAPFNKEDSTHALNSSLSPECSSWISQPPGILPTSHTIEGDSFMSENSFSPLYPPVNDIQFHSKYPSVLFSGDDIGEVKVWDLRQEAKSTRPAKRAIIPSVCSSSQHTPNTNSAPACISSIALNHHNEYVFAAGDNTGCITLWDLRQLTVPMLTLKHHTQGINRMHFSHGSASILGSASDDGTIIVWDIFRSSGGNFENTTGCDSSGLLNHSENCQQYGLNNRPPQVLFVHVAHRSGVADFCWNNGPRQPFLSASVGWDNRLCCWQMAQNLFYE